MPQHPSIPHDRAVARPRLRGLLALVGALALGLFGALGSPSAAAAFDEGTIHSLVNQSRAANSLGPLTLNASLSQVAANWANQLAANGTLSHNLSYSSQIPGGWTKAAENVAQGYGSGAAVHDGWMNSAGHRANILGDFTDIGIAHVAIGGTTWSVEVFAKYGGSVAAPKPAPKPAPAPAPAPKPAPEPKPVPPPGPSAGAAPAPSTPPPSTTSTPAPSAPSAPDSTTTSNGPTASLNPDTATTTGSADAGHSTTKLVLGLALLLSLVLAVVGWSRFHRWP